MMKLKITFELLLDKSTPRIVHEIPFEVNPDTIKIIENILEGKESTFLIEANGNICGFQFDDKRNVLFRLKMNGQMLMFPLIPSEKEIVWKMFQAAPAMMKGTNV